MITRGYATIKLKNIVNHKVNGILEDCRVLIYFICRFRVRSEKLETFYMNCD